MTWSPWQEAKRPNGRLAGSFFLLTFSLVCCATHSIPYKERGTIAVWDLEDLTPGRSIHPDLGEALSAQIIESLRRTGTHTLVERERLLLALEELNLGTTPLVDESTRLEIGRILQARLMVFGGYQVVTDTMRLDLRLVDVETGRILRAVQKTASATHVSGWLEAASEAASELF